MSKSKIASLIFCLIFLCEAQSIFSEEWRRIYLATPPRSGNHWIRYLVEDASGIATGAVYRDREPVHLDKVFPWGGYSCDHGYEGHCRYPKQNDIVLVKTHFPDSQKTPFDQLPSLLTIRIVRHPVDSFYSRYVKNPGGPLLEKVPSEKIKGYILKWRRFQRYWNQKKEVVTFRYEDMLADPFPALKKILKMLKYKVTDDDISRAIQNHPPEGYMLKHIDKFKKEDLRMIAEELKDLMDQFGYSIPL